MCSKANEDILKGTVMKFVAANEMLLETCLRSAYDGHFFGADTRREFSIVQNLTWRLTCCQSPIQLGRFGG